MKEYHVIWRIDVSADSPLGAALEAERVQLAQCTQHHSLPGAFEVTEKGGVTVTVDLADSEDKS